MKRCLALCAALLAGSAGDAAAEAVVFGTAQLTTSGVFVCRPEPACTSFGNSVTLGTGEGATTLTFSGISTLVPISNHVVPVTLGTVSASSSGETFPSRTNRHFPIVQLNLTLTHTSPVAAQQTRAVYFGPGGMADLRYSFQTWFFQLDPGDLPGSYGNMVYSVFNGGPLPMNGSATFTADAGVVPEPTTILLVGTGLLGAVRAARAKRRQGTKV